MYTSQGTKLTKIIQKKGNGDEVSKWIALKQETKKNPKEIPQKKIENNFKRYILRSSSKKAPKNSNPPEKKEQRNGTNLTKAYFDKIKKNSNKEVENFLSPIRKSSVADNLNYFDHEETRKNFFKFNILNSPSYKNLSDKSNQSSNKKSRIEIEKNKKIIFHSKNKIPKSGASSSYISPRSKIQKLICQTIKDVEIPFPNKENSINHQNQKNIQKQFIEKKFEDKKNLNSENYKKYSQIGGNFSDPYNLQNHVTSYQNVVSLKSPNSPIKTDLKIPQIENFKSEFSKNNFYSDLRIVSGENTQSEIEIEQEFSEINGKKNKVIDDITPKIVIEASYFPKDEGKQGGQQGYLKNFR